MRKKLIFLAFALILLLSGCGKADDGNEKITINEDNYLDYFEWSTVGTEDGEGAEISHYLVLKDEYKSRCVSSDAEIRLIYTSTMLSGDLSVDGDSLSYSGEADELQQWPVTAILGIPTQEAAYTENYDSAAGELLLADDVSVTEVYGTLTLS